MTTWGCSLYTCKPQEERIYTHARRGLAVNSSSWTTITNTRCMYTAPTRWPLIISHVLWGPPLCRLHYSSGILRGGYTDVRDFAVRWTSVKHYWAHTFRNFKSPSNIQQTRSHFSGDTGRWSPVENKRETNTATRTHAFEKELLFVLTMRYNVLQYMCTPHTCCVMKHRELLYIINFALHDTRVDCSTLYSFATCRAHQIHISRTYSKPRLWLLHTSSQKKSGGGRNTYKHTHTTANSTLKISQTPTMWSVRAAVDSLILLWDIFLCHDKRAVQSEKRQNVWNQASSPRPTADRQQVGSIFRPHYR